VDLNLKRTLTTDDDPFGRAMLLWSCVRHREQLVNLDRLAAWARDYSRAVLVDGCPGRKRDEALAAALLAAAALRAGGMLVASELRVLRSAAGTVLQREVQPGQVPFDSPAYGAAIVLACDILDADLPGGRATLIAVARRYLEGGRVERPVGMALVAQALANAGQQAELEELCRLASSALLAAGLGYESRAYLAQALWTGADALGDPARLQAADLVEEAIQDSPVYAVLETGQDVVGADGPEGELGRVSRLYLAALHDLAAGYAQRHAEVTRKAREAKYAGTAKNAWLSFLGLLLLVSPPTVLTTWLIWPFLLRAWNLYLRQQFWAATDTDRMVAALVSVLWSGILVVAATILEVGFRLLVLRKVASDAHLADEVRRALTGGLRWWLVGVLVCGVGTVGLNLISTSIQAPPPGSLPSDSAPASAPFSSSP
jgi:hypothetical protein